MKARRSTSYLLYLFAVSAFTASAAGSSGANRTDQPVNPGEHLLKEETIKRLIDASATSVARRYNLTPEQANVAREMLEKNCWQFMNKYNEKLQALVPQMFHMRFSKDDPSAGQVQDFAKQMYPLMKEATDLIVSENVKFHDVLDETQKQIHQRDLDDMRKTVNQMMNRLGRWKDGDYEPGEFRYGLMGTRRRGTVRQPQGKPEEPRLGQTDLWEMYVKTFIDLYRLDEGQQTLAYSILAELKAQAESYKRNHQREFGETESAIERLRRAGPSTKPADKEALAALEKKLDELNQPLADLYEKLGAKLLDIPTEAQRKAFQELLDAEQGVDKSKAPGGTAVTRPSRGD